MTDNDNFVLNDTDLFELTDDCLIYTKIIVRQVSAQIIGSYKDISITYFLSRCLFMLGSIKTLYTSGEFNDCLILYRSLVDRLLHLLYLVDTDSFKEFDDWSFVKIHESSINAKKDPELKKQINVDHYIETEYRIDRYNRIKKEGNNWRRPKAEKIAKQRNINFLYKYGYDHASGFVHPLSGDGEREYKRILGTINKENEPDYRIILHNSIYTFLCLLEESLNEYSFAWIKDIYYCQEGMTSRLANGDNTYKALLKKIIENDSNRYAMSTKKNGTQHTI